MTDTATQTNVNPEDMSRVYSASRAINAEEVWLFLSLAVTSRSFEFNEVFVLRIMSRALEVKSVEQVIEFFVIFLGTAQGLTYAGKLSDDENQDVYTFVDNADGDKDKPGPLYEVRLVRQCMLEIGTETNIMARYLSVYQFDGTRFKKI
jgi:hypothetical protein